MEKPQIDFTQPMTFQNALQNFALSLACVMVALRDEVNFGEDRDHALLTAANLFCSMLEDAHPEAVALMNKLERKILGMNERFLK
jgi:hypothetical protein